MLDARLLVSASEAVDELRALVGQDFDRGSVLRAAQEIDAAGVARVVIDRQGEPAHS